MNVACTWLPGAPVARLTVWEEQLARRLPAREQVVVLELKACFPSARFVDDNGDGVYEQERLWHA